MRFKSIMIFLFPVLLVGLLCAPPESMSRVGPLKDIPVPPPMAVVLENLPGDAENLNFQDLIAAGIVKDQAALIQLGKALFWDMQVGSDGVQACATCHFSAGADVRTTNQISPGLNDTNFKDAAANPLGGDNSFGNSTVPYTANDPLNPFGPAPLPDPGFNVPGLPQLNPNYTLTQEDFTLNGWFNPTMLVPRGVGIGVLQELALVDQDTNDVISSQGIRRTKFVGVVPRKAVERGTPMADIFNTANPGQPDERTRLRRVAPRNAPTVINAAHNFNNFWDGRASYVFNGVNPFGFRDRSSTLKLNVNVDGNDVLQDRFIRVINASLASQATGPPLSDFEMSFEGRSFPDLGKKMVSLRPLAEQLVHPQDGVLGPMSLARTSRNGKVLGRKGLNVVTYADMIKAAFQDQWWNSSATITVDPATQTVQKNMAGDPRTMVVSPGKATVRKVRTAAPAANQYTQMEYNFSLFFGLAVQAYEATLISDETPYDLHAANNPDAGVDPPDPGEVDEATGNAPNAVNATGAFSLTGPELEGLKLFESHCMRCHVLPVTTSHAIIDAAPDAQGVPTAIVEMMLSGDGTRIVSYDTGMYNISVRRTTEDLGGAGTAPDKAPFQNPNDSGKPFPLAYVDLVLLKSQGKLPPDVARFVPITTMTLQLVTKGTFKTPNLRNIAFSGPYFHNGDSATLRQVVEFYARGGNFPNTNIAELAEGMVGIDELMFPESDPVARQKVESLVAFMANALADERVKFERAPFDHPQLFVPNGVKKNPKKDIMMEIPAVGSAGRATPIPTFLGLDPQSSGP